METNPIDDRTAVIDTCTRMMWTIDTRDWAGFGEVFTDKVSLDFTALWGGEPAVLTRAEIVGEWSALLGAFDATQHLLGNHLVRVDGDNAVLTAVFRATHRLTNPYGAPLWTLGGTYRFELARAKGGWEIHTVVQDPTWAEGNKDILTLAAKKAAATAAAI